MATTFAPSTTEIITGLINREFLERFAKPGCVGLSGGVTLVDKAICRAQRHLDPRHRWGICSHAFVFEGRRVDDKHTTPEDISRTTVPHYHITYLLNENCRQQD